jgi:hypothetical protein
MRRFLLPAVSTEAVLAAAPSSGGSSSGALPQQQLAFSRAGNVLTVDADGTGMRLLLRRAYYSAWSPDGSSVAFISGRSGDEEYVANARPR